MVASSKAPTLGIFYEPNARVKVFDYLKRFQNDGISLINFSRSNRFRNAFGSKQTTLKDAREKDSSIKMSDVEEFFRKNVEVNAKPRGYNSLVAPNNNHTYQVDLFFMGYYDFDEEQKNQRRTCSH